MQEEIGERISNPTTISTKAALRHGRNRITKRQVASDFFGNRDKYQHLIKEENGLFGNKEEEIMKEDVQRKGIWLTKEEAYNAIERASVASAFRFLRYNVETNDTISVLSGWDGIFEPLGLVLCASPTPFPIRTYDVTTSFFLLMVENSLHKFVPKVFAEITNFPKDGVIKWQENNDYNLDPTTG